jgi:H+/Cl- antiporter ClcA
MMCLIFAGIMLAIYKARAIALSTGLVNVEPAHHMLPLTFGLALLVAALAGTLGWFLLHSMHRSGVHRLSNAETWPATK